MSDARVRAAIEQMEAWVADLTWEPDSEALDRWNTEFQMALAQTDKASGWSDLVDRAHTASRALDARIVLLTEERDQVRIQLVAQERGNRALKGYGASTR